MVWLDEADLHAAQRLQRALEEGHTPLDLRRVSLEELVRLVPSDLSSWNRIALSSGAIEHEAAPSEAEPSQAFEDMAPSARQHPLLHPNAVRARPAVRLSETTAPRRLWRSELYGVLQQCPGGE